MLDLPRFTFLVGPATAAKEALAERLCAEAADALVVETYFFAQEVAACLGLDRYSPKAPKEDYSLNGRHLDWVHWTSDLETFLRQQFGPSALGHIAVQRICESGDIDIYDQFLIPDVIDPADLEPFLRKFKPNELLAICTSMNVAIPGNFAAYRYIWLATDNLGEQIAQIQRELSPLSQEPSNA